MKLVPTDWVNHAISGNRVIVTIQNSPSIHIHTHTQENKLAHTSIYSSTQISFTVEFSSLLRSTFQYEQFFQVRNECDLPTATVHYNKRSHFTKYALIHEEVSNGFNNWYHSKLFNMFSPQAGYKNEQKRILGCTVRVTIHGWMQTFGFRPHENANYLVITGDSSDVTGQKRSPVLICKSLLRRTTRNETSFS